MAKSVIILGATSAIAKACAVAYAKRGYRLYLAARNEEELAHIASDLRIRYQIDCESGCFDAEQTDTHKAFVEHVVESMQGLDGVVMAFGYLTDQALVDKDFSLAARTININFTGAVSVLSHLGNYLESKEEGFIIGISSVAGDRGRQSNYTYGAAKGGLSLYLQGLRNRLFSKGVHVMTVKPGFVDTAMTFGMPGLFLVASPDAVAEAIYQANEKHKDVVYVPWFWRYIMLIIRSIPERLFKRLSL